MDKYVEKAKSMGFSDAAILPVSELVVIPEYRRFCQENLCGNFDKLPACPPASGTVAEMRAKMLMFDKALILQTMVEPLDMQDAQEHKKAKIQHNILTEELMAYMRADGVGEILMMGAGPWKNHSCMSAYCVDAQKMADTVGMTCWENDGLVRYFSLLLCHDIKKVIF